MVEELFPAPDPSEAAARLQGLPYLLFLDSAATQDTRSRYSFLTADPFELVEATGRRISWQGADGGGEMIGNVLEFVRERLRPWARPAAPGLPPFQGGAAGYLGYDFAAVLERIPGHRYRDIAGPDVALGLYDWVLCWDHQAGRAWVISTGMPATGAAASARAGQRLELVRQRLNRAAGWARPPVVEPTLPACPTTMIDGRVASTFSREDYLGSVQRVVDYILAGDVFQVNLSQRLETPAPADLFALYTDLRRRNPAPFAAYLDFGARQILSASPERFLHYDPSTHVVETRPIKGTRPRGRPGTDDALLGEQLRESEKDRAENVMIVDLLRNDLSRVCEPGTVRVPGLLQLEVHPTVFHLVSTITGRLRPGLDAADLLCAAFPGGSITGAPKVRAMEIIAELEPTHRGPYCGSIGYWSVTGALDTSIVIRSYVASGGRLYFQVGGGIVADSDPEQEYRETLDKAAALITAASVER